MLCTNTWLSRMKRDRQKGFLVRETAILKPFDHFMLICAGGLVLREVLWYFRMLATHSCAQ